MIKNVVSRIKANGLKVGNAAVIAFVTLAAATSNAYAAGEPGIVSGAKNLASDVLTWLLILIPISAGAGIGYQALMKTLNQDPAEVAHRNKNMKNILVAAVVGESAMGIVTALLAYFK